MHPVTAEVAGATRLELATSGVTGRRSNQLSYAPNFRCGAGGVTVPNETVNKGTP